jgi:genome maintenance exonuclease 1
MNSLYNPNRFNYTELKKQTINGSRKYITPDGFAVPSVTTILEATKPEEAKKALANWRNRVGHKQAQAITTEASGRGTRLHKWVEDYIKTGVIGEPGSNPYSQQSHEMAQSIIEKGLKNCNEFWGTEVSLYFPEWYAGTTDLVGVHNDEPAVMDYKQTNKPKKAEWVEDYYLQLMAYIMAHNEVYGTDIRKGVIFMCSRDFQYQEFTLEPKDFNKWQDAWLAKVEEYYTTGLQGYKQLLTQ